jgi:hypothetical protein
LIDGWGLNKANIFRCNELRGVLGIQQNNLFDTEYLIWGRIPCTAIIKRWPWDIIRSTLGSLFPALSDPISPAHPPRRRLADLRYLLHPNDPDIGTLVKHLIDGLKLPPQNLTTKQFAMMILGWSQYISEPRSYNTLEADLARRFPDQIAELDYRLYAKTCRWNVDQRQSFVQSFDGKLESLKHQLRIAIKFNLPTYEDWLAERNAAEERACTQMQSAELDEQSLLSILRRNGLELPTLSFCLPLCGPQRRRVSRRSDIDSSASPEICRTRGDC